MSSEKSDYIAHLQLAIREQLECSSIHIESSPVKVALEGKTVFEGEVEIFGLKMCTHAKRCYAWVPGGTSRGLSGQVVIVLEIPPVHSARSAVLFHLSPDDPPS